MKRSLFVAALVAAFSGTAAQSAVVLLEDFTDELSRAGNRSVLNFTGFSPFSVTDGTVDLIRSGDYGIICETSACVDLDGSTRRSGKLASGAIAFLTGVTYDLTVRASGNQRNAGLDRFEFGITGGQTQINQISGRTGFSDFMISFTALSDFSSSIFLRDLGRDNIGAVVDRVTLSATEPMAPIPLPAGLTLLATALGGPGLMRRRRSA